MCTNPRRVRVRASAYYQRLHGSSFRYIDAPCGKCAECLSQRQSKLSIRCATQALESGSLHFLTLTYAPIHEPIAQSLWRYIPGDYSNTLRCISEPELLKDKFDFIRSDMMSLDNGNVNQLARQIDIDFASPANSCYQYIVRFAPSLNYRDVRLWLKSCRVAYEREFGEKLPEFKYCIVGEYGERYTKRPHYHCLFFGLSEFHLQYFASRWKYGNFDLKTNIPIDDFGKVASYLGKYVAKGPFENENVKEGLTIKSRLCTSKGLCGTLSQTELDYFRCTEFADYTPYSFVDLSRDVQLQILSSMKERLCYRIYPLKCKFKLPDSMLHQIFGDTYSKVSNRYEKSPLHLAYSDFICDEIVQRSEDEFKSFLSNFPSESLSDAVAAFDYYIKNRLKDREQGRIDSLRKKLQRAKL